MRHTRRLKRGGGFFDFFKKKENPKIKQNNNYKTIKNTYFKRKTEQFPKQYFKYWFAKMKPEVVPKNNSLLNTAFGKAPTGKASNYQVVQDNNNLEKKRKQENIETANNLINYDDRDYLRSLDILAMYNLMYKGLIKREPIQSTINRVFVLLYLKYKKSPLLTEQSIIKSYTTINNPDFSLELTQEQLNELRSIIKTYSETQNINDYDKLIDKMSTDIFNTSLNNMTNDIRYWEKPGNFIYRGNKCFVVMQGDTTLNRTIQTLLSSDIELKYKLEISSYTCLPHNPKFGNNPRQRCIQIVKSIEEYNAILSLYDDLRTFEYIVIKNFSSGGAYDFNKFNKFTYLQKMFIEGNLILIHPRLGFIIQKMYPDIWAGTYWFSNNSIDPMTTIVLLTLQKYSALRRYDATEDDSWSSIIYRQNPFEPSTAYELKNPQIIIGRYKFNEEEFLEELIDNQIWVNSVNEEHYKRKKASGDTYGIRYRTLKDLDKLLPTPNGFKPKFFWQFYDSKNKDMPKILLRHKDILYNIAGVKRNRNRNVTSSKIARKLGDTWKNIERMKNTPQYATQQAMDSYYRNFFNTSPSPLFPRLLTKIQSTAPKPAKTPRLTEIQGNVPKPSFPKTLTRQNSNRMLFEPKYTRRTRKNRK